MASIRTARARPNGLKLSDGGWRRKGWNSEKAPPPASVRWSALLGGWLCGEGAINGRPRQEWSKCWDKEPSSGSKGKKDSAAPQKHKGDVDNGVGCERALECGLQS